MILTGKTHTPPFARNVWSLDTTTSNQVTKLQLHTATPDKRWRTYPRLYVEQNKEQPTWKKGMLLSPPSASTSSSFAKSSHKIDTRSSASLSELIVSSHLRLGAPGCSSTPSPATSGGASSWVGVSSTALPDCSPASLALELLSSDREWCRWSLTACSCGNAAAGLTVGGIGCWKKTAVFRTDWNKLHKTMEHFHAISCWLISSVAMNGPMAARAPCTKLRAHTWSIQFARPWPKALVEA